MTRVEFKLTMPGRNTWNGKWSGDEKHYALLREIDDPIAEQLDHKSWSYSWGDGWRAHVEARIVRGEVKKSHGFCGYDWMVDSILRYNKIYADHDQPKEFVWP
jgi:hypothetical protein